MTTDNIDNIPSVPMPTDTAIQTGRHLKAALLHLLAADELVEGAGVDLAGRSPLAQAFRAANEHIEDLDLWAIANAYANGSTVAAYAGTEHWCHTPGGTLPTV